MKHPMRHLVFWLSLLCAAPGTGVEVDFAALKTFSLMGKEEEILEGDKEVELLSRDGKGCLTHIDKKANAFSAYRFHDDDPVCFQTGLKLTCRCGEELHGKKLHDPPETEYTTYTWVYQW